MRCNSTEFRGKFIVIVDIFDGATVGHGHICDGPCFATVMPLCTFPIDIGAVHVVLNVFMSHVMKQTIAAHRRLIDNASAAECLNFYLSFRLPSHFDRWCIHRSFINYIHYKVWHYSKIPPYEKEYGEWKREKKRQNRHWLDLI